MIRLLLIISSFPALLCCQNKSAKKISTIDSLYQISRSLTNDSIRLFELTEQQASLSNAINYMNGLARVDYLHAYFNDINNNLDKAAENYFKCLEIA